MDRGGGTVVLLKEIIKQMEIFAPSHLAEEWDNVGLTIGDKNKQIKKILVALDVIPEVIEEAIQIGADLIVTHHPMILFQKIKNIQADTALGKKFAEQFHAMESITSQLNVGKNLQLAIEKTFEPFLNKLMDKIDKGIKENRKDSFSGCRLSFLNRIAIFQSFHKSV